MIITRTPFRMSFFGGGTDIPEYFNQEGVIGSVLSTTFDKYCYVTVRHLPPFFEYRNELVYSKIERNQSIEEFEHPAVRNALQYTNLNDVRITYDADLPARSGLGTSSSFAVGLLKALYAIKSELASKHQIASDAIYLERVLCEESGGWQDQVAASYGGLNRIKFSNGNFIVNPILMDVEKKNELENNLFLYFTGFTRISSEIYKEKVINNKYFESLDEINKLVDEAENCLTSKTGSLDIFGEMLHETWLLKKGTSKNISNTSIDDMYELGLTGGAKGGKLLGAGNGGFLLFYVPKESQSNFIKKMGGALRIPFKFENHGSQILYKVVK